jgi:hypothetical protein
LKKKYFGRKWNFFFFFHFFCNIFFSDKFKKFIDNKIKVAKKCQLSNGGFKIFPRQTEVGRF